jgi:very-short-patch-repair endonuclease
MLQAPIKTVKLARRLRKDLSPAERLLWWALKQRPGGFRFRKQCPQGPYSLDFACLSARLAVEVDGEAHGRGIGLPEMQRGTGTFKIWVF